MEQIFVAVLVPLFEALRKKLCKNNQPQKNEVVVRAADRSLSFLFQYKLNTAVCQVPDAKYPDATERSEIRIFCGGISSACPDTLSQAHRAPCPSFFSGIVHFGDISAVVRYNALSSAVSLGNTLLCLFRRR